MSPPLQLLPLARQPLVVDLLGMPPLTIAALAEVPIEIEHLADPVQVVLTLAARGPAGNTGPAGTASAVEAVADAALAAGMPLSISRANGHFVKADASSKPLSFVAGLAAAETSIGFIASSVRGSLVLADWTAVTGSAALQAGLTYFLGAGGGLTATPPGPPNCITAVGIAASATTLIIEPENPIQL